MQIRGNRPGSLQRDIRTAILSVCIVCLFLFIPAKVRGQAKVDSILFPVLLLNNTAASNGMGGVSLTDVDESASFHNPGAQGVFHLNHSLALSVPSSRNWFKTSSNDLKLKTFGASAGYNFRLVNAFSRPIRLSLSAAFSQTKLELGKLDFRNTIGEITGTVEPFDEVSAYTLSVGLDYFVRVGFGMRITRYQQNFLNIVGGSDNFGFLEIDAGAASIGGYGELTLRFDNQGIGIGRKTTQAWALALTPSLGYVQSIGLSDFIAGIDKSILSTPQFANFGMSVTAEVNNGVAPFFSVRYARERQDVIYRVSQTKDSTTEHYGIEIGLLGAFYYRVGRLDDPIQFTTVKTDGYGFRLRGILAWLEKEHRLPDESTIPGWFLRRIDLRYDRANRNVDPRFSGLETKFVQVAFSL